VAYAIELCHRQRLSATFKVKFSYFYLKNNYSLLFLSVIGIRRSWRSNEGSHCRRCRVTYFIKNHDISLKRCKIET